VRVLLDENLPHDLISELVGHEVVTVQGLGWAGVKNGDLLRRASGQVAAFVTMERIRGSHHMFRKAGVEEKVNLEPLTMLCSIRAHHFRVLRNHRPDVLQGARAGTLPRRASGPTGQIEWAVLHQAELLANWEQMKAGQPLNGISPLE
jgi:hypothetical protein